jgi:uncharacterized protein (DUF58 family)
VTPPASPRASSATLPATSAWIAWLKNRLRLPRRLRVTRDGKYYVGITLGVGFAAINTGNNLLYLLLGLLLALIVISGVLSEMSLRHLRIARRLPRRAQVERPHIVEIEVFNEKRRVPSYAIEVEDLRASQAADKRCFYLKVSPQSAQIAAYRRTPARRGLDHHVGFRVATRFPFGLFEKSLEITAVDTLITYPAVDPVRLRREGAPRGQGPDGAQARGHGDEIVGIRPMREGDDPRDIYWRRSAHVNLMVLKERARETRNSVDIFLDDTCNCDPTASQPADDFERRIRDVASRAVAHLRHGDVVRIRTATGQHLIATPLSGADAMLTFLALLPLSPATPVNQSRTVATLNPNPNSTYTPTSEPSRNVPSDAS